MIQQQVFYNNQQNELKELIGKIDSSKIFVVRAGKSFELSGAESFIQELLDSSKYSSFSKFETNPQLEDLNEGVRLFKLGNYEMIIAIGGGSVLDMAKLISVFAHQNENSNDIVEGKVALNNANTPLLTVPTTAGSGAEATAFAVIYIGKQKYSISNEALLPKFVYLDSSFSETANAYLTACTGLDAFCQAVESVWSVNACVQSEGYALQAIQLIWANIKKAVLENNQKAKEQMQQASFLAGKAINITKTTAPHALSYAFTSYYGIPHGHAVALSLPFFIEFNYQLNDSNCTDLRGAAAVKSRIDKILGLLGVNIFQAKKVLLQLFESINVNINILELIKDFDPQIIIDNVNVERLKNNPRQISKDDIANFLNA